MREIKFRMWNSCGDKSKFLYSFQALECMNQQQLGIYDHEKDGCAFEQFTGLKDKNGKEIYEGDIVQLHDGVGDRWLAKIAIEDGCANAVYLEPRFNRSAGIVARFRDYVKCFVVNNACEVIGNIHENPELLNGD